MDFIRKIGEFYERHALPRLIDCAMKRDEATRLRAAYVPRARGVVLEIGIGSGLNVPFYTREVTRLYGIDPSAELLAMARTRTMSAPFPVELLNQGAEHIPLAASFGRYGRRHMVALLS